MFIVGRCIRFSCLVAVHLGVISAVVSIAVVRSAAGAQVELLATSEDTDTVSVIDPTAGQIERVFSVGSGLRPVGPVAVSGDGTRAVLAGPRGVYVLDVPTVNLQREIPLGNAPAAVAAAPMSEVFYVAAATSINVIDAGSGDSLGTIALGSPAIGIAFSPDGTRAYAATSQSLIIIDTATRMPTAIIPIDGGTAGPALSADGSWVYVGATNCGDTPLGRGNGLVDFEGPTPTSTPNRCQPAIEIVDTVSQTLANALPFHNTAVALAALSDGSSLLVSDGESLVQVAIPSGEITAGLPVPQIRQIVFAPDGRHAFLAGMGVAVLDTRPLSIMTALTPSGAPSIALTPDGAFLYLADPAGSVSVVSTTTTRVVAKAVATFPRGIAVTPDGGTAYVAANALLELDPLTGAVRRRIPVRATTLGITPDGATLYATTDTGIVAIAVGSNQVMQVSSDVPLGDFAFSTAEPVAFVSAPFGGLDLVDTGIKRVFASLRLFSSGDVSASGGSTGYVVVSDNSGSLIRLVSPAGARAFDAISLGMNIEASQIVTSADGTVAYVSVIDRGTQARSVLIVDLVGRTPGGQIPVDVNVTDLALDRTGQLLFAADSTWTDPSQSGVIVVDVPSRSVVNHVAVGTGPLRFAVRQLATADPSATPTPTPTRLITPSATSTASAGREYVLVANFGSTPYAPSSVSVIDAGTQSVVGIIATGTGTNAVAAAPDGRRAYALNLTSYDITVIDLRTMTAITTIDPFEFPGALAVSPDGATLYVADGNGTQVAALRTEDYTVRSVVRTTGRGLVTPDPSGVFFYATGSRSEPSTGVSPLTDHGVVTVVDARMLRALADVPVVDGPEAIAFSPIDDRAYVLGTESNAVSVIDRRLQMGVRLLDSGPAPRGLAITPDGLTLYTANYGSYTSPLSTVSVIDADGIQPRQTIPVGSGPRDVAIGLDGRFAYVPEEFTDSVSVVDTVDRSVLGHIPVGNSPVAVCVASVAGRVSGLTPAPSWTPCSTPVCPGSVLPPNCFGGSPCDCYCEATPAPTLPPTRTAGACVGDCNGDGVVGINELITGVNIDLGIDPSSVCPALNCNTNDLGVYIDCLIIAVNNALNGCSLVANPTATPSA